jgi:hypothetical protein
MYAINPRWFLTEEQNALRESVARLARERVAPRAAEVDESGQYPQDIFDLLTQNDLIGITIPEAYGGAGAGLLELCIVVEELAKVCTTTALMPVMSNIAGVMLMRYGSEKQKSTLLPQLARGEVRFSNALTEADAGSDAASIRSRATTTKDGYEISGAKSYITGTTLSDFFIVFAKHTDGDATGRISAFLVPREAQGISIGPLEKKMGIRGMPTGGLFFDNVSVPREALLGPEGRGLSVLLSSMTGNRPAIGARGVGLAQGAFEIALDHCLERRMLGGTLMDLQGLQFKLADLAIAIEASRQLVHAGARLVDNGVATKELMGLLAMGKCLATDTAMNVAIEAVQFLGATGYSTDAPVERLMRDAKHLQIVDGSNEIQRVLIGRALREWRGHG